jgi:multisubunit Na+/H+ antiporter MnhC subunit
MNQPVDVAFVITSIILGYVAVTVVLAAILYVVFNTKE